jgi:DNA-binding transcriptional regulator YhcF (GntR family)
MLLVKKRKAMSFFEFIEIKQSSTVPKYLQLANAIIRAIEYKKIRKNDFVPSLNELTFNLEISKQTAERAYKYLSERGILNSVPGKGHFIAKIELSEQKKVILLLNKLSTSKKLLYDAFVEKLGSSIHVDLFVYNNDLTSFKQFFLGNRTDYTHYIIMPPLEADDESIYLVNNEIPKEKLIILDKRIYLGEGVYGGVYENFEKDIFEALERTRTLLKKYTTLKIFYSPDCHLPKEIIKGVSKYCKLYSFNELIINNIKEAYINKGDVFICLTESHLSELLDEVQRLCFKVGVDIGIISYNETPLKEHVLNGITTISTDFKLMGVKAAQMVLEGYREEIELDFLLNIRASL